MLLLGIIVTGTHQARRTANASTDSPPAKIASAVQAAVKALVAFPLLVRWPLAARSTVREMDADGVTSTDDPLT